MTFVVITQQGLSVRVFGPYRSFKQASADASAWKAAAGYSVTVHPIEGKDAPEPWNPYR